MLNKITKANKLAFFSRMCSRDHVSEQDVPPSNGAW